MPLDRLLKEVRQAIDENHATPAPNSRRPPSNQATPSIGPFFRGDRGGAHAGRSVGALLLVRIALLKSFTAITVHEINAHGHAQIFGWVGLFVMGFAYQAFPRFKHTTLAHPRWAYSTLWLMLGGVIVRSVGEPLASAWPWVGGLAVAAAAVEAVAVVIFIAVIAATFRRPEAARGLRLRYSGGPGLVLGSTPATRPPI